MRFETLKIWINFNYFAGFRVKTVQSNFSNIVCTYSSQVHATRMRISLVLQVIVLLHYVELHLGRLAFPFLASSVIPTSNGARFSQQTSDDLDPELEKYYLPKVEQLISYCER